MSGYNTDLRNLITNVIGDSREKLAQAEIEVEGVGAGKKNGEKKNGEKKEEAKEETEKAASFCDGLLKTASALDFIADNIGGLVDDRPDQVKVAEAFALVGDLQKVAVGGEPHKDAGNAVPSLDVPKVIPMETGLIPGGPKNALETDLKKVPGGTGLQPYKKDGIVTPAPKANEKALPTESASAMATDEAKAPGDNSGPVPTNAYPEAGVMKQAGVPGRFARVLAKQAGALSQLQQEQPSAYDFIREKLAENAIAPAVNQAGKNMSATVVDGGDSPGTPAEVGVPAQPKQNEGSLRKLVTSGNESATDFTPREAFAPQKKRLAEVLDTPAQSAALDSKLKENVEGTTQAGTKLSSAEQQTKLAAGRALLSQLSQGEYGDAGVQLLKQAAERKLAAEGVEPTGEASGSPDTQNGDEEAETTKKEKKEKALQKLLQSSARTEGERKE